MQLLRVTAPGALCPAKRQVPTQVIQTAVAARLLIAGAGRRVRPIKPLQPPPTQQAVSRGVVLQAASSGACMPSPADCECSPSDAEIILLERRLRAVLMALGGFAAWAYLTAGVPGGPFASVSMAGLSEATGTELAIKSGWTGLATGVFHTLCGPDHLAGLAPLSIGRGRLAAAALGGLWGFGHSTGQLVLGLVFALLKDKFHDLMPALDKWAAYIVPLTLITIGVVGIYENIQNQKEQEALVASGELELAGAGGINVKTDTRAGVTTYLTGIVHGLQPDALYVVIPALALPTKLAAVSFISMFVFGTVFSMAAYTLFLGTTSKALIKEQPWLQSHLSSIACGIAILFGMLMLLAAQGVPVPLFS